MNIAVPHRPDTHAETRLAQLAAQARSDLAMLDYATRPWVLPLSARALMARLLFGAAIGWRGHWLKNRGRYQQFHCAAVGLDSRALWV